MTVTAAELCGHTWDTTRRCRWHSWDHRCSVVAPHPGRVHRCYCGATTTRDETDR